MLFRNPSFRTLLVFVLVGMAGLLVNYVIFGIESMVKNKGKVYKICTRTVQKLYIKCTKFAHYCTKIVHELYKKCTLVYKNCTQSVQKWYTEKVKVQILYGKVHFLYAKVQILVPLIYTFLKRSFARLASEAKLRVYNIYNIYRRSRKK